MQIVFDDFAADTTTWAEITAPVDGSNFELRYDASTMTLRQPNVASPVDYVPPGTPFFGSGMPSGFNPRQYTPAFAFLEGDVILEAQLVSGSGNIIGVFR